VFDLSRQSALSFTQVRFCDVSRDTDMSVVNEVAGQAAVVGNNAPQKIAHVALFLCPVPPRLRRIRPKANQTAVFSSHAPCLDTNVRREGKLAIHTYLL
ncbi:MAG: hypothetical protein AAF664_16110, partial [Planctomycetota bacterium]